MNSCDSEGVAGTGLSCVMTADYDYDCTVVVKIYQVMIEQRNPLVASTLIYRIQNEHLTKNISVIFNAYNIKKTDHFPIKQSVLLVGKIPISII